VVQGVGPEFKSQHHKKKKERGEGEEERREGRRERFWRTRHVG
jgi:hypothetical protein